MAKSSKYCRNNENGHRRTYFIEKLSRATSFIYSIFFQREILGIKYPLQNRLHYHGVRVYLPLFGSSSSFGTGLRHFLMLEVLSGHCAQFNPVAQYVPVELSSSVHVPPAAISIVAEIVQISLVIYWTLVKVFDIIQATGIITISWLSSYLQKNVLRCQDTVKSV